MDKVIIPLDFFKELQCKHHHIRLLWFKWFSEYSEKIFEPNFVEYFLNDIKGKTTNNKLDASLFNYETIRDAYSFGIVYIKDGLMLQRSRKKAIYDADTTNKVTEIINYLNEKSDKMYKQSKSNVEPISARLKEGYTVNDFKRVIDTKVKEWKNTEFEKYIRPETLFRPKNFDNYLNQPETKKNGKQSNIEKLSNATDIAKQYFNQKL